MSDQGTAFAAFVKEELEAERKRREALDQRGFEAVKIIGTVVTLVLGLAAVTLGIDYRPQSRPAVVLLLLALLLLFGSAICALTATRLLRYAVTSKEGLDEILNNRWDSTETTARSTVAQVHSQTIMKLRTGNDEKADWLARAHWLLLIGLVLLVVTVVAEVATRTF